MSVAMPAAVTLRDLTVSYRGHPAVHHLSGAFMPGVLTAVVGPNGAGKSSLLGAMGGTVHDFEGAIERDPALRVAYLPQASALDRSFPVRVHELVAMCPRRPNFDPPCRLNFDPGLVAGIA
jgi:zinc/manganese transport system ATP-binding protein